MKKKLNSIFGALLLVTSIISGSGIIYFVLSADQVVLSVEPQTVSVEPDQAFTLSVYVGNVENLYKWTLSISWDPAVIELDPASTSAIAEGSFLKDACRTFFRTASYVAGSGYLSYISCELTQPTSSSGSGTLLTLCFKAAVDGETGITIRNDVLYDFNKQMISHTCKEGHVSVRSANHDVRVSLEAPAQLVLGNSVLLNATVQNLGDVDETNVNLAILVDGTVEKEQTVSLPIGVSYPMCLNWTPSHKGVYTIAANATPLPSETKTDDNYLTSQVEVISLIHDVAVSLQCPARLVLGKSTDLVATVTNVGTFDEANLEVAFIIDGTSKEPELIEFLAEDTSEQVTYEWTPAIEGTYNITVYVHPVPEETNVTNNRKTKSVDVVIPSTQPAILIVADDDGYYYYNGTSLTEFELALQSTGYDYDVWEESVRGRPTLQNLATYELVIWTCGDFSGKAVHTIDAQTLEDYLYLGGNILIEGENVAQNNPASYSDLWSAVLHIDGYYGPNRGPGLTVVDSEHAVAHDLPINFTWAFQPRSPDRVRPLSDAHAILSYANCEYTAVNVFEGTQVGAGSVVYYAFPLYCLGRSLIASLVSNSMQWLIKRGISSLASQVIHAPTETAHFIYADQTHITLNDSFGMIAGSMFYALCSNPQSQGFTTTRYWLSQNGGVNSTHIDSNIILLFGNPTHNVAIRYYEGEGETQFSPIRFSNDSDRFMFLDENGEIIYFLPIENVTSNHEDAFVIYEFTIGENDFLVVYGFGWSGEWAAGVFLTDVISKNLVSYSETYYVFHWHDLNMDGIPQVLEIEKVASG